ncbi:nuclear transport factor 2 family protein [Burkholderia pseudomallei]|nr:nuclear transport factor 2 family protein [Burkholderia pseudomallei]
MSQDEQYSLSRIADRLAIQDAMYRWCRAVDRLDYDEMRAAFHPDGTDNHGIYSGDVDGLIEWIRERHKTIPVSMHQVSNMLIEFAGPDLALVETYVRTTQHYPENATSSLVQLTGRSQVTPGVAVDLLTCSRYIDRFQRRNGEWRVLHRTLVQDWKQIFEVPTNILKAPAQQTLGFRNKNDFIYRERTMLGIK